MTNHKKSNPTRIAFETAAFLGVDEEVCRIALYNEPRECAMELIRWIAPNMNSHDRSREELIDYWARKHGAGRYNNKNQRSGGLVHPREGALDRMIDLVAVRKDTKLDFEYDVYVKCVCDKEMEMGRQLNPYELNKFARWFHTEISRRRLQRILPKQEGELLQVEVEDEDFAV